MAQRQINLTVLAVLSSVNLLQLLAQIYQGFAPSTVAVTAGTEIVLCALLIAYWRGWGGARYGTVIAVAVLVGVALPEPYVSGEASFALLLPPALALVLASPIWVVGSGLMVYLVVLARAEFQGVYSDPLHFIIYSMVITGVVGARLMTDTAFRRVQDLLAERKQVLEVLEQQRRQLQHIIDSAPTAIAMFDTNMCYLAHSQRWTTDFLRRVSGNPFSSEQLLGQSFYDAIPTIDGHWRRDLQLALTGEPQTCPEELWHLPDGTDSYMQWSLAPWYHAPGQIGGIVMVTGWVDELVMARESALEVSRLKSEFLATMSHEIRTPMSGVIGMTELLLETELSEDQAEFATIVRDSASSLLVLINDILDFSKIEAGKVALESIDFGLVQLVERTTSLVLSKAHERSVALSTFISPDLPPLLRGDSNRLSQILLNLVGNAVKFTEHGSVTVHVSSEEQTTTHATIRVAVIDTGIGLSEAARRRLFQPFTQADGSMTRRYGGSGLGLVISKRLIELMGGTLGVESVEGRGSTFWFTLRLERAAGQAIAVLKPLADLQKMRALVVDADANIREIVQSYLASAGLPTDTAANATEATTLLANAASPYAVVLGTWKLLEDVARSRNGAPETRYMLLKNFAEQEVRSNPLDIEIASVLTKPIKQAELLQHVQETLRKNTARGHAPLAVTRKPSSAMARSEQLTSGPRILIAEDNLVNQRLVFWQLQKLGYAADTVSNGHEAVAAATSTPYLLILMDCQMPEFDGFEATAALRAIEQSDLARRHIPIVAMTANALEGDRELCLQAGMDDYLAKPASIAQLKAVIEHWVSSNDAEKPAGGNTEPEQSLSDQSPQLDARNRTEHDSDPAMIDAS